MNEDEGFMQRPLYERIQSRKIFNLPTGTVDGKEYLRLLVGKLSVIYCFHFHQGA